MEDDVRKWFWVHQWISFLKYIQCDVLLFSLSSKLYLASIKNTSWLWRTFLTPGMEMGNPRWIQCDVPDHTFHVEKDWGWFLYPALRYQHLECLVQFSVVGWGGLNPILASALWPPLSVGPLDGRDGASVGVRIELDNTRRVSLNHKKFKD